MGRITQIMDIFKEVLQWAVLVIFKQSMSKKCEEYSRNVQVEDDDWYTDFEDAVMIFHKTI